MRQRVVHERDERVDADVHRRMEAGPTRLREGSPEVVAVGVRDRVHEDVDGAQERSHRLEERRDVIVVGDVALLDEGCCDTRRQRLHAAPEGFRGVREADARSVLVKGAGDCPRDGALVRNAEHNRRLPVQECHAESPGGRLPCWSGIW